MAYVFQISKKSSESDSMLSDIKMLLRQLNFIDTITVRIFPATYPVYFQCEEVAADHFKIISYLPSNIDFVATVEGIRKSISALNLQNYYEITRQWISASAEVPRSIYKTDHQQAVDVWESAEINLPSNYKCSMTTQVMDAPVRLPGLQEIYIDYSSLVSILYKSLINPFTQRPVELADFIIARSLQIEIEIFIMVEIFSREVIEKVNACLDFDPNLHGASLAYDAINFFGDRLQPNFYQSRNRTLFWQCGYDEEGEMYRRQVEIFTLNYPSKTQTTAALKHIARAILNNDTATFFNIVNAYPDIARKHLIMFANGFSQKKFAWAEPAPRPLNKKELEPEPHFKRFL
jgi:hypothetical protein